MSGYTPAQEAALCRADIQSYVYIREQHQRTVDMFTDMIADSQRRLEAAEARLTGDTP